MSLPDLTTLPPVPSAHSTAAPALVDGEGRDLGPAPVVLADDHPVSAEGGDVLAFERALRDLPGLNGVYGVRVLPGDDVRRLTPVLDRISVIEVAFPGFRDGRGYSSARILREDMGYEGPLRAVGDVLRDQLWFMLRCRFDQFVLKDKAPEQAIRAARARFEVSYQSAADATKPAWALRHSGQG